CVRDGYGVGLDYW
nr:immunoglobulin heavy chain junction region [Macaca mulatta]